MSNGIRKYGAIVFGIPRFYQTFPSWHVLIGRKIQTLLHNSQTFMNSQKVYWLTLFTLQFSSTFANFLKNKCKLHYNTQYSDTYDQYYSDYSNIIQVFITFYELLLRFHTFGFFKCTASICFFISNLLAKDLPQNSQL